MHLEPIQQVAILIAASTSVFLMAVRLRPDGAGSKPIATWSRFAHEAGLGVLTGGFVSLASLATVRVLPKFTDFRSLLPHEQLDDFTLVVVVSTLFLLCIERGRWTGHQPATILAALVPWLFVPEWGEVHGVRLPAEQLGLISAALYRVVLSGARSERLSTLR